MTTIALIVAGGIGTRFDDKTLKQHALLSCGISVMEKTLTTFANNELIDNIAVVIHPSLVETYNSIISKLPQKFLHLSYGKSSRQESVKIGLKKCYGTKKILIHDCARPFVSQNLINNVIKKLDEYEAVDVGLPITDTIKTYDGTIIDREKIYATQTPQGFHNNIIKKFYEAAVRGNFTDDISLYIAMGGKNYCVIDGEKTNIKITYKEDLLKS